MDPNNGPGDLGHPDGNQLATQARYSHNNYVNMEGEGTEDKTGLETVDFGTYAATLTASTTDADVNNTLEVILRNMALPEDQIQAILAAVS